MDEAVKRSVVWLSGIYVWLVPARDMFRRTRSNDGHLLIFMHRLMEGGSIRL